METNADHFPSCSKPLFQGEAKCEASERYKNDFCSHAKKGFALSIVLKLTVFGTWKWSIATAVTLWVNSEQAAEV